VSSPTAPPLSSRTAALAASYSGVRRQTLDLCLGLSAEDMLVQALVEGAPDASPTKWHLAHTSWFFETFLLAQYFKGYRSSHPDFRAIFNSYYNAIGKPPARELRGALSRPSLDEVFAYRQHVDEAMQELLAPNRSRELPKEALDLIELGLNHEQQHQELIITDAKHALWSKPARPAWKEPARSATGCHGGTETPGERDGRNGSKNLPQNPLKWLQFNEGIHEVGHSGTGFAFDNESPRHKVYLHPFEMASRLATNAEFMEFIADGGYTRPELWLSEGWQTVRQRGWKAPMYWERQEREWLHFTCEGMRPIEPNEPVCHISYFEAEAFARWSGSRLPTEFEWEVAAANRDIRGNFLESGAWHPLPAPESQYSAQELLQIFGDCWEWTSSAYAPYPGYRPAEGAVGEYNGKFMVNQYVLRGGSCATPRSHIRASYRNFFPTHARWQFSGVRLARDAR